MQPESIPPTIDSVSEQPHNFRRIVRYLLAGNPFFVLSAVLLLYAMRRLSFDSRLFSTELSQLIFNFSSFQFYEVLLVGTAILLARRKIWYDSTLLIFIETMFAFVPLILVSQALLVENSVAAILCIIGATLIAVRTGTLSRSIRPLNFPPRLLEMAFLLVIVNVAAPVWTRHMHKELTSPQWDQTGVNLTNVEWFILLPGLVLLGLLLARSSKDSPSYFSRTEFPLLILMLWIVGTGVHFYCVNYVYGLPRGVLRIALAAPAIWMACWVLWMRRDDVKWATSKSASFYEKTLLSGAVAALIIPALSNDRLIVLTLATINVILFAVLAFQTRSWFVALLLVISGAMAMTTLRFNFQTPPGIETHIDLGKASLMTICGFLLLRSIVGRHPTFGFLGGIVAAIIAAKILPHEFDGFAILQAGLVFVVLHSLRWEANLVWYSNAARWLVTSAWLINSIAWLAFDGKFAFWGVFASGIVVFAVAVLCRWISGFWAHAVIAWASLATISLPEGFKVEEMLEAAPTGLLVLLASFLLFAVGIMTALTRSRWLAHTTDRRVVRNL
jgi:hypothetical protein